MKACVFEINGAIASLTRRFRRCLPTELFVIFFDTTTAVPIPALEIVMEKCGLVSLFADRSFETAVKSGRDKCILRFVMCKK